MKGSRWLSVHVHFSGLLYHADGDAVLLQCIRPAVDTCIRRGWTGRFFFIRYSESGPHIRLRIETRRHSSIEFLRDCLPALLQPALSRLLAPGAPDRGSGDTQSYSTELRWLEYEPELDRYGGVHGVRIAERFFHASSRVSLQLLAGLDSTSRADRLGKAALVMLVLLRAMISSTEGCRSFLHRYTDVYLRAFARDEGGRTEWQTMFDRSFERQADRLAPYILEAWHRLEQGEPLLPALDEYRGALQPIRWRLERVLKRGLLSKAGTRLDSWLDVTSVLLPSYLHMMNNRMGVSIPEESYLSHVLFRALERISDSTRARHA